MAEILRVIIASGLVLIAWCRIVTSRARQHGQGGLDRGHHSTRMVCSKLLIEHVAHSRAASMLTASMVRDSWLGARNKKTRGNGYKVASLAPSSKLVQCQGRARPLSKHQSWTVLTWSRPPNTKTGRAQSIGENNRRRRCVRGSGARQPLSRRAIIVQPTEVYATGDR